MPNGVAESLANVRLARLAVSITHVVFVHSPVHH